MHWPTLHPHTTLTHAIIWALAFLAAIAWSDTRMSGQAASAKTSGLKILVIAGEDAVNVIKKKTEVAPPATRSRCAPS